MTDIPRVFPVSWDLFCSSTFKITAVMYPVLWAKPRLYTDPVLDLEIYIHQQLNKCNCSVCRYIWPFSSAHCIIMFSFVHIARGCVCSLEAADSMPLTYRGQSSTLICATLMKDRSIEGSRVDALSFLLFCFSYFTLFCIHWIDKPIGTMKQI